MWLAHCCVLLWPYQRACDSFWHPQWFMCLKKVSCALQTSGNDIIYRNPANVNENLFVDVSSPSSSAFASVEDLGTPDQAAKRTLDQVLCHCICPRSPWLHRCVHSRWARHSKEMDPAALCMGDPLVELSLLPSIIVWRSANDPARPDLIRGQLSASSVQCSIWRS